MHARDGDGRPALPRGREPEQGRDRGEHRHRQKDEAIGLRPEGEREDQEDDDPTDEQAPHRAGLHRPVPQPLQANGSEHGDRDHGQVPHPPRVMQVHVAEGQPEHEPLEPPRRHDHVQHQDPCEHEAAAERPDESAPVCDHGARTARRAA